MEFDAHSRNAPIKRFGYLHADGYKSYHKLVGAQRLWGVGCMHDGRKFDEAAKAIPAKGRPSSGALEGMDYCNRLFAIERQLIEKLPEERHTLRQDLARPVLNDFFTWLKTQRSRTGKTALGAAVN